MERLRIGEHDAEYDQQRQRCIVWFSICWAYNRIVDNDQQAMAHHAIAIITIIIILLYEYEDMVVMIILLLQLGNNEIMLWIIE